MTDRKKRPATKKKTTRKKVSAWQSQKVRLLLASLFLLVFVGFCLYLLVSFKSSFQPEVPPVVTPAVETVPEEQPVFGYQDIYAFLDAELLSGPKSFGWQKLPVEGNRQRLQMFGDFPDRSRLLDLSAKLAQTGAPTQLDLLPRKGIGATLLAG